MKSRSLARQALLSRGLGEECGNRPVPSDVLAAMPALRLLALGLTATQFVLLAGAQDPASTDIWSALRSGDVGAVRALLDQDAQLPGRRDNDKRTPLHLAARFGHTEIARLLLNSGADPEAEAYNRFRPLHLAIEFGRTDVVALLLERRVDLEAKTAFDRSPLQLAARRDREPLIEALLKAGAHYDILTAAYRGDEERVRAILRDDDFSVPRDAIEVAVRRGHAGIARAMLPRLSQARLFIPNYVQVPLIFQATPHVDVLATLLDAGLDPDVRMKNTGKTFIDPGSCVLHVAAKRGHVESLRHLLELEVFAQPDEWRDANERTPAHTAAQNGSLAALIALHEKGADLLAVDRGGRTTVHHAAFAGRAELLRWLVGQGITLDGEDRSGRNALIHATRSVHPTAEGVEERIEAAWVLVRHGVRPDLHAAIVIGDDSQARALLEAEPDLAGKEGLLVRAVSFGRTTILTAMLDAGAAVDVVDKSGNSPLHWAGLWRRPECARILIAKGATVDLKQRDGRTPLHEAARANALDVARVLLDAGADASIQDREGRRPRDFVTEGMRPELRELLR